MGKRKRKKRQDASRAKAGADSPPSTQKESDSEAPTLIRGWRRGVALVLLMTVVPALFFLTVEMGLRLAGYGYPTSYFIPWDIEGRTAYVENREFGRRFFPPGLERVPHYAVLPADKAEGTVRIFVMGASAALGDPDSAFSIARILEVMLKHQYPDTRFEVYTAAATAINSNVVLPIARDCARRDPDIFVVYLGNNEVVGPFGAGSVFTSNSGNLPLIRAQLAVKRTRIGQLVESAIRGFGTASTPKTWRGLEMFMDTEVRQDDPRMEAVYQNFERNLVDIAKVGERAGARVVLCTVGVNEGDWAPFASSHAPGLDDARKSDWQTFFDEGIALQESGNWSAAAQAFTEAEAIDDSHGELQYRLGRCVLELGQYDDAQTRFALARDLDTLRFRADSRINEVIRSVSARLRDERVLLADAERILSKFSPNGIPGSDLFYDQVHLTFAGNYLIALGVRGQVEQALSESLGLKTQIAEVPSLGTCADQLALTGWDVMQHLKYYYAGMSRPPFTKQYDHAERMAKIRARQIAQNSDAENEGRRKAVIRYRTALEAAPNDTFMRRKLAILLLELEDYAAAEPELRQVVRLLPHRPDEQIRLGKALRAKGDHARAEKSYRDALEIFPDSAELHGNLALVLADQGRVPEAIKEHRVAIEINPYRFQLRFNFASTLALNDAPTEAIEELRAAIELRPEFAESYLRLASLLINSGRAEEAVPVLDSVIELLPGNAEAYKRMAVALSQLGRTDEAQNAMQKASDIESKAPSVEGR